MDLTIFNPATSPAKAGTLNAMHRSTAASPTRCRARAMPQLRNGATVLSSEEFGVSFESEYDGHGEVGHDTPPSRRADSPQADLSLIIPWVDGATSIALVQGHGARQPRGQRPRAGCDGHQPGVAGNVAGRHAADAHVDGQRRRRRHAELLGALLVQRRRDMGPGRQRSHDDELRGGRQRLRRRPHRAFRVVATDGVNIGTGESAPVSIPNQAPYAVIVNPENGGALLPGNLVIFSGSGVDMEDGRIPDGQLAWSSNRQARWASGRRCRSTRCSPASTPSR